MSLTGISPDDLRREADEIDRQLVKLDGNRAQLTARREAIAEYFSVVERLQGVPQGEAKAKAPTNARSFNGKKRIRSTGLVASVVIGSGKKWTREQIREGFDAKYGIPDWENPDNALSNAIGRAVAQGLIAENNSLYFDPAEFKS